MRRLLFMSIIFLVALAGCKHTPVKVDVRPVEFREGAPLVSAMHKVAVEFDEKGTEPGTEKTKFMRAAAESLKVVTGDSEPLTASEKDARAEGVKYQNLKEDRERDRKEAAAAVAKIIEENRVLRARKEFLAWSVLGIIALVSAGGVVLIWIRFSDCAGFVALIIWLVVIGGLTLGTWYEFHQKTIIVGGIAVAIVVAGAIALIKLMGKDLTGWVSFGSNRVVYTQAMRRELDAKTRAKVDAAYRKVMAGDPADTENVKRVKVDLGMRSVTDIGSKGE